MNQPDLFTPKPVTIIEIANANAGELSMEFLNWLPDNQHVWNAFVEQTLGIIARGFQHYSSRTILEFMRHHSAISETNPQYKLNNNIQPYLPRLFDIAYPQHAGLFEYRVTTKAKGHSQ